MSRLICHKNGSGKHLHPDRNSQTAKRRTRKQDAFSDVGLDFLKFWEKNLSGKTTMDESEYAISGGGGHAESSFGRCRIDVDTTVVLRLCACWSRVSDDVA